jgi:uncharacterized Zn finger protein
MAMKLTAALIRAQAEAQSFTRGQALYDSGALSQLTRTRDTLSGLCEGTETPFYAVSAKLDEGGVG